MLFRNWPLGEQNDENEPKDDWDKASWASKEARRNSGQHAGIVGGTNAGSRKYKSMIRVRSWST